MRLMIAAASTCLAVACGKSEPSSSDASSPSAPSASAAPKLDQARAQAIVASINPGDGWQRGIANAQSDGFMVSFGGPEKDNGAKVNLIVAGVSCMGNLCAPLDAASWKPNEDSLKGKLSQVHRENPALVWQLGETEVDGHPAIVVYTLSYVEQKDDSGTSRMSMHSYDLFWHNGQTLVDVTASGSTSPHNVDELRTQVTKDELEAAAKKMMRAVIAKL